MARPGKPAVQVEGARELRRALKHMDGALDDLTDTNRSAAETVEAEAERTAPRRSGALAGDHRVSAGRTRSAVLVGRRSVPYAGVIHFGWPEHNIEPQPWLYEAADRRAAEVATRYRERVAELVRRVDVEA